MNVEGLEKEDYLSFHLLLILQLGHIWHLETLHHLLKDLKDTTEPWILHLEDDRFSALFDYAACKSDHQLSIIVLETLHEHLLDIELIVKQRSVPSNCQLSKEGSQCFQVLLDL